MAAMSVVESFSSKYCTAGLTFENIVVPVLDRDRKVCIREGVALEDIATGAAVGSLRFITSLVRVET